MSQGPNGDGDGLGRLFDASQRVSQLAAVGDAADDVAEQHRGTGREDDRQHRLRVIATVVLVTIVDWGLHDHSMGEGKQVAEVRDVRGTSAAQNGTASSSGTSGWPTRLSRGRSRAMRRASSSSARSGDITRTATVDRLRAYVSPGSWPGWRVYRP